MWPDKYAFCVRRRMYPFVSVGKYEWPQKLCLMRVFIGLILKNLISEDIFDELDNWYSVANHIWHDLYMITLNVMSTAKEVKRHKWLSS
jgi:hypothetical protein